MAVFIITFLCMAAPAQHPPNMSSAKKPRTAARQSLATQCHAMADEGSLQVNGALFSFVVWSGIGNFRVLKEGVRRSSKADTVNPLQQTSATDFTTACLRHAWHKDGHGNNTDSCQMVCLTRR